MKKKFEKEAVETKDSKKDVRGGRRNSKAGKSSKGNANFQSTNIGTGYQMYNAANFSFANVVGTKLTGFAGGIFKSEDPKSWARSGFTVPGVMAIELHPCIGTATSPSSAINIAANNVYTWVRHANSGHTNYDPADLMMYILAVANAHMFHSFCVRLYGSLQQYKMYNNYYPSGILQSMGISKPETWYGLMPQFRNWMWEYQAKLNTREIPHMDYIDQLCNMFRYVYKDAESEKAQIELFVPTGFYFHDLDEDKVGMLKFKPLDLNQNLTLESLMKYGNDLLDALYHNEDAGIMSGDILKAYGEGTGLYHAPDWEREVASDYVIMPMFNAAVQDIIRNTVCVGTLVETDIRQNKQLGPSNIGFTPEIELVKDVTKNPLTAAGKIYYQHHPLIEGLYAVCDEDRPSPERVMNLTTFMPSVTFPRGVGNSLRLSLIETGLCIATRARIYTYREMGGDYYMTITGVEYASRVPLNLSRTDKTYNPTELSLRQMSYLQSFTLHLPTVLAYQYKNTQDQHGLEVLPFRDWDSYTHLDGELLAPLHRARVLDAFGIKA